MHGCSVYSYLQIYTRLKNHLCEFLQIRICIMHSIHTDIRTCMFARENSPMVSNLFFICRLWWWCYVERLLFLSNAYVTLTHTHWWYWCFTFRILNFKRNIINKHSYFLFVYVVNDVVCLIEWRFGTASMNFVWFWLWPLFIYIDSLHQSVLLTIFALFTNNLCSWHIYISTIVDFITASIISCHEREERRNENKQINHKTFK